VGFLVTESRNHFVEWLRRVGNLGDLRQSATIYFPMQGNRQRLEGAPGERRTFTWLPRCGFRTKPNESNSQDILARENPQLGHQATASSSKLAKMVGLGAIPSSAKIFAVKVE
jgi:hypothetical protein